MWNFIVFTRSSTRTFLFCFVHICWVNVHIYSSKTKQWILEICVNLFACLLWCNTRYNHCGHCYVTEIYQNRLCKFKCTFIHLRLIITRIHCNSNRYKQYYTILSIWVNKECLIYQLTLNTTRYIYTHTCTSI